MGSALHTGAPVAGDNGDYTALGKTEVHLDLPDARPEEDGTVCRLTICSFLKTDFRFFVMGLFFRLTLTMG